MNSPPEFVEFPKLPRLSRDVIVTEKIDGTNAQIWISDDLTQVVAGSRSRWIYPNNGNAEDNFGFATWVEANRAELLKLGPGRHFGEWWGSGIQRKYGLTEKRFSLFNVSRWENERPACCHVVPVLYRGLFSTDYIDSILHDLRENGSAASPGFMNPEGIVVFHIAANIGFKKTIHKDEVPKSVAERQALAA